MRWKAGTTGTSSGSAVGCLLSSSYGFLAGAWPFGVVEAVWSLIALRRYLRVAAPAARVTRDVGPRGGCAGGVGGNG